jgi:hypothetical protein
MTVTAWMTFEQAIGHALLEAEQTGYRYRVFKSRSVVGWWNAARLNDQRVYRVRAARQAGGR